MCARLHLDHPPVDAVSVKDGQIRVGVKCLGSEDPAPRPRTAGEQLHRDHRVEAGLPAHDLEPVALPGLLRIGSLVEEDLARRPSFGR